MLQRYQVMTYKKHLNRSGLSCQYHQQEDEQPGLFQSFPSPASLVTELVGDLRKDKVRVAVGQKGK